MKRPIAILLALAATGAAQATVFELVSLRTDDTPPATIGMASEQPGVTPDGRYVVFAASTDTLAPPFSGNTQIYLRDRVAGTTELVSVSNAGQPGDAYSGRPSISDDGCRIAFYSYASNLVAGDTNGLTDIFVRDRCASPASTTRVSVTTAGVPANGASFDPRISANGRKVVFSSYGQNMVAPGDLGYSSGCILVRDLVANTTTQLPTSGNMCRYGNMPDLSADGSRVVFWTQGAFLPQDTNNIWDIYLSNLAAGGALSIVTSNSAGTPHTQNEPGSPGEGGSTVTEPAISRDGGYVAFRSRGGGLLPNGLLGGGTSHVFLKEVDTGTLVVVSYNNAGVLGNADSAGSGSGERVALSDYAGVIAYRTNATNLAAETGGTTPTIVLHDPRAGTTAGFTNLILNGQPAVSATGGMLVASSNEQLDARYASRGFFAFANPDPAADSDNDGIPNGVEPLEGRSALVKDNDIFSSARLFAMQQYRDFLSREGDAGGIGFWANQVQGGTQTRAQAIQGFFASPEFQGVIAPVARLYFAYFLRVPDYVGLQFHAARSRAGTPLATISNDFAQSPEFVARYGALTNDQFIELVYQNVLGRPSDPVGKAYWLAQMAGGATRGTVMLGFSNSPEYVAAIGNEVFVTMMYVGMLRRAPDTGGFAFWVSYMDGGQSGLALTNGFLGSPEYRNRFLP